MYLLTTPSLSDVFIFVWRRGEASREESRSIQSTFCSLQNRREIGPVPLLLSTAPMKAMMYWKAPRADTSMKNCNASSEFSERRSEGEILAKSFS